MPIGDVSSTERGSGARYNDGKVPLHQVPARYWVRAWAPRISSQCAIDPDTRALILRVLRALVAFQEGEDGALGSLFAERPELLDLAVDVFAYGEAKYALYNWCKGMAWSVPVGCALRHARALTEGEALDPESGLPHLGHAACNLVMLDWFLDYYPEGDDRPAKFAKGQEAA